MDDLGAISAKKWRAGGSSVAYIAKQLNVSRSLCTGVSLVPCRPSRAELVLGFKKRLRAVIKSGGETIGKV
jgi:hypothetical protein